MKKIVDILIIFIFSIFFTTCASTSYLMDGVLPFEYYQNLRKGNERLVFFSPVLAANHSDSFLYIITNPEDIYNAHDIIKNINNESINELNRLLNNLSPIVIRSTIQALYGDGLASFTIPENVKYFFYIYLKFNTNEAFSFNSKTKVSHGIMPLPIGSENLFIGFTESENNIDTFAVTGNSRLKSIYDSTYGLYGIYLSKKKKQIGFNEVTFSVRFQYLQDQSIQARAKKPSNIQQMLGSLARDRKFWDFTYYEWSDGCKTTQPMHGVHQRETIYVNRQIEYYNNYIQQNDAQPYGSSTKITYAVYSSDGSYYEGNRIFDRYVRYSLQLYQKYF